MQATNVKPGTKGEFKESSEDLTLHFPNDGNYLVINENDIVSASPTFKSGTSESNQISVGGAVAASFNIGLYNDDWNNKKFTNSKHTWTNAYFDVYYTAPTTSGGTVRLYMGRYWIDTKKESGRIISFSCYDFMSMFDEYTLEDDGIEINDSTTSGSLIDAICSARGINYRGLKNSDISIPADADNTITERAAISYAAQICGQYAVIRDNELVFDWYTDNSVYDAGTTFGHDLDLENLFVNEINISVANSDSSRQGKAEKDGGYIIDINSNPFISEDNLQQVSDIIIAAVNGLNFRAGSFSVQSNPAIEAGDRLTINTGDESGISTIATSITYKTSTLQETISADANSSTYDKRAGSGNSGQGGCNHPDAEVVKW